MSDHQTVFANDLNFAYLSWGEGPLLLCLHGFPDSAHTWQGLGPRFAALGYHVVAPFLRGYAPTDIPSDNAYGALTLGNDVLALIAALSKKNAVVIGHDWGALAAYFAANLQPDAVSKLITLAIPHPASLRPSLGGLWRARHFITYQFRQRAMRQISANGYAGVDEIYRRWSPRWDFAPEETAVIKQSFAQNGRLEAALGYYWSFRDDLSNPDVTAVRNRKTAVPALCLVGDSDGALDLTNMPRTATYFSHGYRYEILPNVGHFLHREDETAVFHHIKQFLET